MNPTTIPGDLAPDLLTGWTGPGPDRFRVEDGAVWASDAGLWYKVPPSRISLPLLRRECRLRAADWLAEGLACFSCFGAGEKASPPHRSPECPRCNGTGYLRPPAPAWHLLDVSTPRTAQESAELLAWSAVSVARGGVVVRGVYAGGSGEEDRAAALGFGFALRAHDGLVLPALPEAR